MIIDVTWPGNEEVEQIASDVDIPYIRIDISISPQLSFLDKFLEYKNSTDVTVIFDSADSKFIAKITYYCLFGRPSARGVDLYYYILIK